MSFVFLNAFVVFHHRKRNERFFTAGRLLVDLITTSTVKVAKQIASKRDRRPAHTRALEQVSAEAQELRRTLLKTYAGERLRRTFDWALSSGGDDDVSPYLSKLTEMEQRLFHHGSSALAAYQQWRLFGNRHLIAGITSRRASITATPANPTNSRPVTPGVEEQEHRDKRQRVA